MSKWSVFIPPVPHPFAMSASDENWVIVSGVGGHAADGSISEDPETQIRDALASLSTLLSQAGSSPDEVVWFKPYLTQRGLAPLMDRLVADFVGDVPPAAGALTIVELVDPRMVVEFEVWAARGARRERS